MREIRSGDQVLRVRASSLAIFFYKQEFKTDILKDISAVLKDWTGNKKVAQMVKGKTDQNQVDLIDVIPDGYTIMQITWALNKAQNSAEDIQTPRFEEWIKQHQDISVMEIMQDVLEEAMNGFFRIAPTQEAPE